jgi:hypothetical protein
MELLSDFLHSSDTGERIGLNYSDVEKACDSVRRAVL